ncbi:hypothetical protein [Leptolinea tardivitalis]|uniref:Uncharacterized protein n=1 Tax=Leptolinea tardivitalis TaxID=229920 RepID=A0A0P6XFX0_9CHLR|nr:hypothetical protein [Leptolinea tardivitalis]KPL73719.1 hypothetical protein ADM99_02530 [Leptolinea tardivitalis]GAP22809.1 hypothetical protein LTAR_03051 [Leptolinea tardivitalis]
MKKKTAPTPPAGRPAWLQLYDARSNQTQESRPVGRPPAPVPRYKVGMTLSQGESADLKVWQDRFSEMLGRKISSGETVGILARICSTRYSRLAEQNFDNMMDLIEHLVEGG